MKKNLKEAISGGERSFTTSTPIISAEQNPVVKDIQSIIAKKMKDVELVRIEGAGDVWHIDLRFECSTAEEHAQYARELGKERAYDIKRELEKELMTKHSIPSFSIQGIRVVDVKDKKVCEFAISFIYANKGNIKITTESKSSRIERLIESILVEDVSPITLV